jgi:sister chromatid cohesion protein PDS5
MFVYEQNFYMVCEMAQEILKMLAHHRDWNITTYPQKIKLPSDILRPMPNAEASTKVILLSSFTKESFYLTTWVGCAALVSS